MIMTEKQLLQILIRVQDELCVTISLNTHRTHPDNLSDRIKIKNFIGEAIDRLTDKYDKRVVAGLIKQLEQIAHELDINYNLESLHIFVSGTIAEVFKSSWETNQEGVHISNTFAVRPLVKEIGRQTSYLVMLLSQSGVHLFRALNGRIVEDISSEEFPIAENQFYNTFPDKSSDAKHLDDLLREYLNRVDKALLRYIGDTKSVTLVFCTEDNYSKLLQVADRPSIYYGYLPIDYNNIETHQLESRAWNFMKQELVRKNEDYFKELEVAVGKGLVITDLQEIYRACQDGRGDILVVQESFHQAVKILSDQDIAIVDNPIGLDTIDDISSLLALLIDERGGQTVYVPQIPNEELQPIALKIRY
ncbi:baeRF3 domain-containing protein [Sphingobacterium siyangense]|jgi:hypothetical protein|uniref:baeRF3 domain-containing protein n=1 Tax=Sphingobacterium siyangense TaxID=459529 RepID=UPI0028B1AD1E|nr:hypothetical protein [Sphingobacterium siyangense]